MYLYILIFQKWHHEAGVHVTGRGPGGYADGGGGGRLVEEEEEEAVNDLQVCVCVCVCVCGLASTRILVLCQVNRCLKPISNIIGNSTTLQCFVSNTSMFGSHTLIRNIFYGHYIWRISVSVLVIRSILMFMNRVDFLCAQKN